MRIRAAVVANVFVRIRAICLCALSSECEQLASLFFGCTLLVCCAMMLITGLEVVKVRLDSYLPVISHCLVREIDPNQVTWKNELEINDIQ